MLSSNTNLLRLAHSILSVLIFPSKNDIINLCCDSNLYYIGAKRTAKNTLPCVGLSFLFSDFESDKLPRLNLGGNGVRTLVRMG